MRSRRNSQETKCIYGTGVTPGTDLFCNNLVATTEFPDPTTGLPGTAGSDEISQQYDWQGDVYYALYQSGDSHVFAHDALGRETADSVLALGSASGPELRQGYTYNIFSLLNTATTYSNYGGTIVMSQVEDAYNGFGQLTAQYQEHNGAVNTTTSASVQYAYGTAAQGSRILSMMYPNQRQLDYVYNSGLDSSISRVSALADDSGSGSGTLASYLYLGAATIVQQTNANNTALTAIQQTGDTLASSDGGDRYTGLDRFGRNIDQNYINTSTGVSTDRFQYGYDPNSNVLYKSNLVSSANSELYHINGSTNGYDNLNRLPAFSRGTLNSTHDTITAASRSQTWSLDALGNWTSNTDSVSGTQTRSANAQDQLSAISGNIVDNTATAAVLPTYDNNGNTTKDERGYTYTYDAWNRILTVKNASGVLIATYAYDALGNRISITENGVITDLYYNGQQVIEERQSGTVINQYVWSLGYVNNLLLRDDNSVTGSLGKTGSGLGVRVFAQHDAVYNTTALTDGTPGSLTLGAVVARFEYDPYGAVSLLTPAWASTTIDTYHLDYYFQGGRYDPVTGLLHFDNRDFSPSLGTWVERDPAGYLDGANDYQGLHSSPVDGTDPLGLGFWDSFTGGFQAIGNLWDHGGFGDDKSGGTSAQVRNFQARRNGAMQFVGGSIEMCLGIASSETGIGVLAAVHGADVAGAGWQQMMNGQPTAPLTATAVAIGVNTWNQQTGLNLGDPNKIGRAASGIASIVLTAGAGASAAELGPQGVNAGVSEAPSVSSFPDDPNSLFPENYAGMTKTVGPDGKISYEVQAGEKTYSVECHPQHTGAGHFPGDHYHVYKQADFPMPPKTQPNWFRVPNLNPGTPATPGGGTFAPGDPLPTLNRTPT